MKRWMLTAAALAVSGMALAKLPPPQLDEAAKAKAAETAAKAAWQAKLDAFQLCKAQDRVAAMVKKTAVSKPAAAPVAGAPAAPVTPPAAAMPVATPATASQGGSTPNTATSPTVVIPPCGDPGPFAYAPPAQKPLETAGAHSPTATAASPPSVRPNSAELAPAKPGTTSAAPAATGAPTPAKK